MEERIIEVKLIGIGKAEGTIQKPIQLPLVPRVGDYISMGAKIYCAKSVVIDADNFEIRVYVVEEVRSEIKF